MDNVYRNYSSTIQKIQMISQLRITTREEAIAFLRAVGNINVQIADILQRESLRSVAIKNRERAIAEAPATQQVAAVEVTATEAKEETVPTFEDEDIHSEEQITKRIKQLKKK